MRHIISVAIALATLAILFGPQAQASDVTKVDLTYSQAITYHTLDVKDHSRVLFLNAAVERPIIADLVSDLRALAAGDGPIYLVIDSPGGLLSQGNKLIRQIKALNAKKSLKLICVIEGSAYSMAAIIQSYCYQSYMLPDTQLMYHQASYGITGTAKQIDTITKHMEKRLKEMETNLAKQMGITYEQYELIRRDELWLTANEAAKGGFVDGLLEFFYYESEQPGHLRSFFSFLLDGEFLPWL